MAQFDYLKTIPIGSLLTLPDTESDPYFGAVALLPKTAKTMVTAVDTGAYIRGLTKSHGLAERAAPRVALAVLKITVGKEPLGKLPSILSTEVGMPNDQAQKMADEIEKDLLRPVMPELEEYWRGSKGGERKKPDTVGLSNVLNLKEDAPPPPPPPMPE